MSRWQFYVTYGLPITCAFIVAGMAMMGLSAVGVPDGVAKVVWAVVAAAVLVGWFLVRRRLARR